MTKPLQLSPREYEVLQWTACGKTANETATLIGVTENTVRAHLRHACKKLDAVNKAHAVSVALVHGLLKAGPSSERVIPLSVLFGLTRASTKSQPAVSHAPPLSRPNNRKTKANTNG